MFEDRPTSVYRAVANGCWWAMVVATAMTGFWLLFGTIAWGSGPIPRIDKIEFCQLVAFATSTFLFRNFLGLAVLIAWLNLAVIVLGVVPWVDHSWNTFVRQFAYDHLFFIAANVGLWAQLQLRRSRVSADQHVNQFPR